MSASVLAPTAAEADALANAFYVMGPEAAQGHCKARADVAAVMVCPGEREGSLRTHVWGLAADDWTPLNDT
jgi:thiamine biosynthesis lipoprotein